MTETFAIGLDVGGTKIAGAIVNTSTGEMLDHQTVATLPQRGGGAVLQSLADLDGRLRQRAEERHLPIDATGVGVAELVDRDGIVRSGHTIPWHDVDVASALRGPCVVVLSDVVAGSLAEARLGTGRSVPSFLYVSVGTGVSSTFVIDGVPWLGANGNAIVLASGALAYPTEHPPWLAEYVPERLASGPGLQSWFLQHSPRAAPVDGRSLASAAAAGDATAAEAITLAARVLGSTVGLAVNLLDPHRVVAGGGLGAAGGLYWSTFLESLRHHIWAPASRTVDVVTARFGAHAGTIGAALAAAEGSSDRWR